MQVDTTHEHDRAQAPASVRSGQLSLLFFVRDQLHVSALRDNESLVVGRAQPASVVLDDPTLSRSHARLSVRQGQLFLEDLGSRNGCLLNEKRVSEAALSEGDVVRLGAVELRISGRIYTARPEASVLHSPPEERAAETDGPPHPTIVSSPCMIRLYELIERAARTTIPVLIEGETGSGKELVARAIHRASRPDTPMKALNCATIPASLIEGILFGHERGAFTGAGRTTAGIFEQARGGTVFLDEVAELSSGAQAALLRVLDHGRVLRVGGSNEVDVDVRVVAATHSDLGAMVRACRFREDLLYRLNTLTVYVPPLRERHEEIVPLAELFLHQAHTRWSLSARGLSVEAKHALLTYPWPGNVRELKNVMERAATLCTGSMVGVQDLPLQVASASAPVAVSTPAFPPNASLATPLPERVRDYEMTLVHAALERAGGNQARAARELGIPRRTLAHKLQTQGKAHPGTPDSSTGRTARDK
ncbi:MAG TPA: sigma 54-interacting transcriptional regulator [Polyangiales bacterium]